MNSAATTEHSAEQPAVSSGSAAEWTISASLDQVEVPRNKQTHTRRLPLPFTIDAWIMGEYYGRRQYLAHGKSKVSYSLSERLLRKLCEQRDQEPDLFRQLQATGVYTSKQNRWNKYYKKIRLLATFAFLEPSVLCS